MVGLFFFLSLGLMQRARKEIAAASTITGSHVHPHHEEAAFTATACICIEKADRGSTCIDADAICAHH